MDIIREVKQADARIRPHIKETAFMKSDWLTEVRDAPVYLKLESDQHTGSFKARGSLNKLMWMREQHIDALPVTASTGNHGLGFARALDLLDMEGKVFLPENAEPSKVEKIRGYGAEIVFHGTDPYTTELHARRTAEEEGWLYVSPYNDPQVIGGQGTIGMEMEDLIAEELGVEPAGHLYVTVGGGGLMSGVGGWLSKRFPELRIVGCQPENSPEMSVSVQAGEYKEIESKPTLSDGSAGGFEKDSITWPICRKVVDDWILVSEEEIKEAIRGLHRYHGIKAEGAAAVAVASLLKDEARGRPAFVVICGSNISEETFQEIVS